MAEQYKDKAVFAKVDINANYQTASSQQIRRVLPKIARPRKCLAPQLRGSSRLQQHALRPLGSLSRTPPPQQPRKCKEKYYYAFLIHKDKER
jgi:hypothetical protein